MIDLAKFIKKEAFTFETKNLGSLIVGFPTLITAGKLASKYEHLKDALPIEIVRFLISLITYPPDSKDVETIPDDIKISEDDVLKISEDELNDFCDQFIEHNKYFLFRNDEGTKDDKEREENEPSINYLSRLILYKIDKVIEEQKIIQKKYGINHFTGLFPNHLTMGILNTLESQKKLYESILPFQKEIDNIQKYSDLVRGLEPPQPNIPFPKPFDFEHLRIERPTDRIRETNEKLDVLIDYQSKMGPVIENSSNLLGDMNKLWVTMEADSKKDSRKIILLNVLIIFISLIGLFSGLFFSLLTYKSSIETSKTSEKYMSLLIEENRKLNDNINLYQNNMNKIIDNQSKTIDSINNKKKSIKVK